MRTALYLLLALVLSVVVAAVQWGTDFRRLTTVRPPTPLPTATGPALAQSLPSPFILSGELLPELARLSEASHGVLQVDWAGLREVGVTRDQDIRLDLSGQSLDAALPHIVTALAADAPLRWAPDLDDAAEPILVLCPASLPRPSKTVVYDISDLLARPRFDRYLRLDFVPGSAADIAPLMESMLRRVPQLRAHPPQQNPAPTPGVHSNPAPYAPPPVTQPAIRPFQTGSSFSVIVTADRLTHRDLDDHLYKLRFDQVWYINLSIAARKPTLFTLTVVGVTLLARVVYVVHAALKRRRNPAPLCPSCGYDLSFSPTRCPECGTAVARKTSPLGAP